MPGQKAAAARARIGRTSPATPTASQCVDGLGPSSAKGRIGQAAARNSAPSLGSFRPETADSAKDTAARAASERIGGTPRSVSGTTRNVQTEMACAAIAESRRPVPAGQVRPLPPPSNPSPGGARRRARAFSRPEGFPRRRRPGEGPPGSPGGGRPCGDRSHARPRSRAPVRRRASRAGWPRWPPPPRIRVRDPAPAASRVFRSDLTKLARRTVEGPEVSLRARRETTRRPSCRGRPARRRPRRRRRERARDAGS